MPVIVLAQTTHPVGDMFKPVATPADAVRDLSYLVLAITAAIFLVVAGLLAHIVIKYRRRSTEDTREPAQVYGSDQIEIAWTVFPILIVVVLTMATSRVISAVQNKRMPANALKVAVIGHQWWWEIHYPGLGIVTANELHVPLSTADQPKPAFLTLQSADVAHSFWVPRIAGKTDLIPNRTNTMWFDPREEGVFFGNCAEYCGTQHANMLLRVIVEPQSEFDKWAAQQKAPAASSADVDAGRATFLSLSCVNCHTVSGTAAAGTFGPDLTHLMSRANIGSGIVPNNPENLRSWVHDPQAVKPGNLMPDMQLSDKELEQVVTYLSSLK